MDGHAFALQRIGLTRLTVRHRMKLLVIFLAFRVFHGLTVYSAKARQRFHTKPTTYADSFLGYPDFPVGVVNRSY